MIKELTKDEAFLSTPCEAATAQDTEVVQDLIDTLESIEDAALLAANQIGHQKAIIAFLDDDGNVQTMLNPKIKRALYPTKQEEMCLTKEEASKVTRFTRIQVSFDKIKDGKLVLSKRDYDNWEAVLIQHGIDHCNGKYV